MQLSSIVWRQGAVTEHDLTEERLTALVKDADVLVWVDVLDPTPAELARIGAELGLDPNAVEDALAEHERPKATHHGTHEFFVAYGARLAPAGDRASLGALGALEKTRVSGFILPTALLTVRTTPAFDMEPVKARWREDPGFAALGPRALTHGLLDVLVDGHFATIQEVDDALEQMEDTLFAEAHTGHAFQREVYALRKDLVGLRRVVLPMRELVNTLLRHRKEGVPELDSAYDDLYDHVMRASEWTESLRDMVTTVFETNLSLQDARLNTVMRQLAAWAAIIAVPTAITGWFGQNLPYWGFSRPWGVWLSVGLIAVVSGVLYWAFRRRDWL
ncbi:MAG: magnesium transporter CorA family protein [Micrococcales bacterium]|nr:magnesium transporter CorA family protein [Micrococcales bacterium]